MPEPVGLFTQTDAGRIARYMRAHEHDGPRRKRHNRANLNPRRNTYVVKTPAQGLPGIRNDRPTSTECTVYTLDDDRSSTTYQDLIAVNWGETDTIKVHNIKQADCPGGIFIEAVRDMKNLLVAQFDSHYDVTMDQVGGSQGDKTTQCSWTYDVFDLAGTKIMTAIDPLQYGVTRPNVGPIEEATEGVVSWKNQGWYLNDSNEVIIGSGCA